MELFVRYDLERLTKYASLAHNSARIRTNIRTTHASLHFADVNYFNYTICLAANQIQQVVEETKAFYQHTPHRLLIEDAVESTHLHTFLNRKGYSCKGRQILLQAPNQINELAESEAATELEPVSPTTLYSFTQDYLASFESDRTDATPVSINFSQLLSSSTIQLYRVMAHRQAVGIAALYQENEHFLLAGGAILPSYRNHGYHTSTLISRLRYCFQNQPKSISAWAYENSTSYQNMCRLGLTPLKGYWIYEHGV